MARAADHAEAKVEWSGDPGPRELEATEELASAPESQGLGSLVPRAGCCLGPQWLWVIFSGAGPASWGGRGGGMSKKPGVPEAAGWSG